MAQSRTFLSARVHVMDLSGAGTPRLSYPRSSFTSSSSPPVPRPSLSSPSSSTSWTSSSSSKKLNKASRSMDSFPLPLLRLTLRS